MAALQQAERQITELRLAHLDRGAERERDEAKAREIVRQHEEGVQASRRQLHIQSKASMARGQPKRFKKRMRLLLKALVETFDGLPDDAVVAAIDRDMDGEITHDELLRCVREQAVTFKGRELGEEDVQAILREMDEDGCGSVSVAELLSSMRGQG